ncbi:MAG TPA: hypothetical protein PK643_14660, partial [Saprospiraceae bacterium]|nr:hypothetical protein [Saprospiraceae bacterium]
MRNNNTGNWQDRIDDYLLGNLKEDEVKAFEIYCFGNPDFLKQVRLREQLIQAVKEAPSEAALSPGSDSVFEDYSNKSDPKFWWLGIAAAILLLGTILFQGYNYYQVQKLLQGPTYRENPSYEGLLEQELRSQTSKIKIVSPEMGQKTRGPITFRWNITPQSTKSDSLQLLIFDNQGQETIGKTLTGEIFV